MYHGRASVAVVATRRPGLLGSVKIGLAFLEEMRYGDA
jgi:hypothetical protein